MRRRWSHDHQFAISSKLNMSTQWKPAIKDIRDRLLIAKGGKSRGSNKMFGPIGQNHRNRKSSLHQSANEDGRLVRGDATRDPDNDALIHQRCAFCRLQIASVQVQQITQIRCFADNLHFAIGGQEDFVLQNFLDYDFHAIVRVHVDQRTTSAVELYKTLLDERREFESSANFIDDSFFF
jgi:hypothetical protein